MSDQQTAIEIRGLDGAPRGLVLADAAGRIGDGLQNLARCGADLTRLDLSGARSAAHTDPLPDGVERKPFTLQGADLSGLDLVGSDLRGSDICGADLSETVLHGGRLDGVFGIRAKLVSAGLTGASLRGAHLPNANLSGARVEGADLTDARLSHALLWSVMAAGARFDEAVLIEANLIGGDFRGASFVRARMPDARLPGADLSEADLAGADLRDASARCSHADGVRLRGARLDGADLRGADLGGADLGGASLKGAALGRTDFSKADLRGADLTGTAADSSNVFARARLEGAAGAGRHLLRRRLVAAGGFIGCFAAMGAMLALLSPGSFGPAAEHRWVLFAVFGVLAAALCASSRPVRDEVYGWLPIAFGVSVGMGASQAAEGSALSFVLHGLLYAGMGLLGLVLSLAAVGWAVGRWKGRRKLRS